MDQRDTIEKLSIDTRRDWRMNLVMLLQTVLCTNARVQSDTNIYVHAQTHGHVDQKRMRCMRRVAACTFSPQHRMIFLSNAAHSRTKWNTRTEMAHLEHASFVTGPADFMRSLLVRFFKIV